MKIGKQLTWAILLLAVVMCSTVNAQETCGPFTFTTTSESAAFRGQATIDGFAADAADCIAAFDQDGNCAGAVSLLMQGPDAYIILAIYGDDLLTPGTDEGMNAGESFTLVLYDASEDAILPLNPDTAFGCWVNTNGTPLPGPCGDYLLVYDFGAGVPPDPPVITCPDIPFDVDACAGDQICVPLVITGATSVTVEGATWENNELCFTVGSTGPVTFTVTATNVDGEDVCDVTVNVTITDPPVITCPGAPFDATVCAGDEICVPLDIQNAEFVTVNGATWDAGQLCFTAGSTGPATFHVVATSQCGEDVCDVTINVTITDPPVITCPDVPFDRTVCAGTEVCVPLEIAGATNVVVEGATWANGELCFNAVATDSYIFTVTASNICGTDICEVSVHVVVGDETPPVIVCPDNYTVECSDALLPDWPEVTDNCDPEPSVDYHDTEQPGSCPQAKTILRTWVATDASGNSDSCVQRIEVVDTTPPSITCPPDTVISFCDPTDPEHTGGYPSVSDNCDPGPSVSHRDSMLVGGFVRIWTVVDACSNTATCMQAIGLGAPEPPDIDCPEEPIYISLCEPGTVCIDLAIRHYDSVTVDGNATWSVDQLCFEATVSEVYEFTVRAYYCGIEVTCDVTINVTVTDPPVITCPDLPFDVTACTGDEICVPLVIAGATSVTVEGATWAAGQLCFTAGATGPMTFHVAATNECGEDACDVTVNISAGGAPVIDCPQVIIDVAACAGDSICIPLAIDNAAEVLVEGATWAGGMLCFMPNATGTFQFDILATNDCGEATCHVTIRVVLTDPPVITCPGVPFDMDACAGDQVCVPLEIAGATGVTVEGATWAAGQLCFTAGASGPATFHVVATNECGEDVCEVTVNVTVTDRPVITCPDGPFDITVCAGDEVCVPLDIVGATSVDGDGATWANGQLCFTAGASGSFDFYVIASNDCGADVCDVTVNVTVTDPPVITCPDGPFDITACAGDEVCVPLDITGATDVTVEGATWAAGQLCFTADATGPMTFHVVATNECGQDECDVTVNISAGGAPVIDCPGAIIDITACAGTEVCIPLAIDNAANVVVEGATWANGMLCFMPNATGTFQFDISATNDCGEATCHVTVRVQLTDPPVITCPDVPFDITACAGAEVCVPLDIIGATNVTVEGATWVNGQLCFTAGATGPAMFSVFATNDCDDDICEVTVNVTVTDPPVIACPPGPFDPVACFFDEVCVPLEISNATSVAVIGDATWSNGQLCFDATWNGMATFHVVATNDCGEDLCEVRVALRIIDPPVIECPGPMDPILLCGPEEVCFDLPIAYATSVDVDGGAWNDGVLCFDAEADGSYTLVVTATNECGADVCTIEPYIVFRPAPLACFEARPTGVPLEIAFVNCSEGEGLLSFIWDFGDGTSGDAVEPTHTYSTPGSYEVTLIVTDVSGCTGTVSHIVEIGGVTPTDKWISIYCPEPMLDDFPLNPGDVIRAYDPDGILCGIGTVAGDGSYGLILIYADDIFTPLVDEGAEPGDEISLTVNGEEVFLDPSLIWNENGDVVMVCAFSTQTCLLYDLDAGWHLISWNVAYTDDVANMIAGFENSVDVILSFDRGGLVYVPSLAPFSTLREVDYHFGYWFRLNSPVSFEICGGRISAGEAISIYGGWNLVSYWPEEMMPVEDALSSIMDNLIVVYGFDHGTEIYEPGSVIYNSLTDMKPQFGYWVKSAASDLLTYAGFSPIAVGGDANQATGRSHAVMSSEWMSIYGGSIQVDNRPLRSGATIELVTTEGVVCGAGVYDGSLLKFTPVYGSVSLDEATESLPAKGDKLSVLVNGERVYPDLEYQGNGSIVQLGRLTGNADGSPNALPDDYSLSQNYPNPFNPSTTIRFNLPVGERVELVVYNLVGQKVATLVDGVMAHGSHEVEWNGTDDSGTRVASGVYLYRLNSASFTQTKKMTLMK